MAGYLFFHLADKAQDAIWDYTQKNWGKKQAENYILQLHEHLQQLADRKKIWHSLPSKLVVPADLQIKIYFSRYEHHQIFFRELSDNNIGIMSILHEKSDIPVRLNADLRDISNKESKD